MTTTQTFRRRVKLPRDLRAAAGLAKVNEYVRRAYGLLDSDEISVSLDRSTNVATVTIVVDGPRTGTKWTIR